MSCDVLIAGAGPAGSLAALLLVRAGVRVRLVDRAVFPRDKLCGDTLNPGAMAILRRHELAERIESRALMVPGMLITGANGVRVHGDYGDGIHGCAVTRRVADAILVDAAVQAGAELERAVVRGAWIDGDGQVRGVRIAGRDGQDLRIPARLTIAADGRSSVLARGLGLTRQPPQPRRFAIGAYFAGVDGLTSRGEMHIRPGHYVGVAPLPGGVTNACLVLPQQGGGAGGFRRPARLLEHLLGADGELASRFAAARRVSEAAVLGPLAVDAFAAGASGLLLAGDAAGFIDPMTGDGMRFALRGAELAVDVALSALTTGDTDRAHERLAVLRRREFAAKWRVNRALRTLVGSPAAVSAAAQAGRLWPGAVRWLIRVAGDVT